MKLAMTTFALTLLVGTGARAADKPATAAHGEHHEMIAACAKACSDCQRECAMCSTHCANLLMEGRKEHFASLMSCQDCADICATAAQIVSRQGPMSAKICQSCADACAHCAAQCDKFPDDKHMKQCADECRKCEKACREMIKHAEHLAK